jgi:hypothetical protein
LRAKKVIRKKPRNRIYVHVARREIQREKIFSNFLEILHTDRGHIGAQSYHLFRRKTTPKNFYAHLTENPLYKEGYQFSKGTSLLKNCEQSKWDGGESIEERSEKKVTGVIFTQMNLTDSMADQNQK